MANTLFAWPDRTLEASSLYGGSWLIALDLVNLQDNLLSKVARSSDATSASTQFVINLGSLKDVRVIALLNHNISLAGTIRVRGYSDSGLTTLVYDTGTQYAWPQTFTTDQVSVNPNNWIWPLTSVATARYWLVEIVDAANAAGYIELGRCWLGPVPLEPTIGIPEGAQLGYESRTVVTEALGGTFWYNRRSPRRSLVITLPRLSLVEKRTALIMQKTLDTSGEFIFVRNKLDGAEDMLLQAFPAVARKVSPLRLAYENYGELPMEIVELI